LTRRFITNDPPTAEQIKELRKHIRTAIAGSVSKFSKGGRPRAFVGTSKTFKQLARIAGAPESAAGIYAERKLTVAGIGEIINRISPMADHQRQQIDGVSAGRSGQMLAGALVAEAAMELFHADSITIGPWALREGVILRALDSMSSEVRT
jgi:exopolyphosphatase/guanosine-5'-triphosphate,3'-diphosphate pyrophosphatase